jgi:integrase
MVRQKRYALNKTKYLLEPEVERLEEILFRFQSVSERDCLLLELALNTGARAQELLNITKLDLDLYHRTVLIRGLKGSNDRELPLRTDLFDRLWRHSERQVESVLFNFTYNRFRQIWDQFRPVPKKLHSLRHTFAIRLYKRTRDLRLVQVALGHRNIANTMVYADYVYSQDELRRLIVEPKTKRRRPLEL